MLLRLLPYIFSLVCASVPFYFSGEVVRVVEGDTIVIQHGNRMIPVRLYGIETPASNQAYYEEAVERPSGEKALLPTQITLEPAWPNPFNGSTRIGFTLPEAGEVTLQILDLQGRVVQTLLAGDFTAGRHSVVWNASESAAGTYFCKLSVAGEDVTTKLILAK